MSKENVNRKMLKMVESFEEVVTAFREYKSKEKQTAREKQLAGALKHIAKYGKNTTLHTFLEPSDHHIAKYEVKQNLDGTWTCTCDDYFYRGIQQVNINHQCKHISRAKSRKENQINISYGAGAIEAHRRLTEIANKALNIQKEPEVKYKIEFQFADGMWHDSAYNDPMIEGNTFPYSKAQADKIVNKYPNYRMVPIEPKPEPLYKLEYNGSYLVPEIKKREAVNNWPTWFSCVTETFTKRPRMVKDGSS